MMHLEWLGQFFSQLGLMRYPLSICSILAFAICLERIGFFIKALSKQEEVYINLANYLTKYKNQPKAIRDEMLNMAVGELHNSYCSGIKILRIIATISPLIGLLGTILGIISAFKIIAIQTTSISPNIIASGLWEAMLTTAAGLMISLLALIMAHLFSSFSNKYLGKVCFKLNTLSMSFEIEKNSQPND